MSSEIWWKAPKNKNIIIAYIKVIRDMHKEASTNVRMEDGTTTNLP